MYVTLAPVLVFPITKSKVYNSSFFGPQCGFSLTMNNFFDSLIRLYGKYGDFKYFTVSWFVSLAWAPCLLWGLYDLLLYLLGKDTSEKNEANMYLRTGTGVILFLIWVVLVRQRRSKNEENN
jgi:hypothetical protein